MLILVEGNECPEGTSIIALELVHAKLGTPENVVPCRGNVAPQLFEGDKRVAEGITDCLRYIEQRRRERVLAKSGDTPSQNLVYA